MCWWLCLLALLFPMVTSFESYEGYQVPVMQRTIRAFPYSVSLNEILGDNRRLYGIRDDDLSSIIDQLNNGNLQRRRRDGHPYKSPSSRIRNVCTENPRGVLDSTQQPQDESEGRRLNDNEEVKTLYKVGLPIVTLIWIESGLQLVCGSWLFYDSGLYSGYACRFKFCRIFDAV